jgi:hypothetical protein
MYCLFVLYLLPNQRAYYFIFEKKIQYSTYYSYVLVVHTLRVAENEILKLDLPAKRH